MDILFGQISNRKMVALPEHSFAANFRDFFHFQVDAEHLQMLKIEVVTGCFML
jgi:hypothetical protein